jgi:isopentenyl phosphate kinase
MSNPIIIKIAGSVITKKESNRPKINASHIHEIAKVLKNIKSPYILVHGAGSFGHPLAKKTGVDKTVISPEQLRAFAKIQELQNRLNHIFCDILIQNGIPAFPAQASSHAIMERGRLLSMNTEALAGLIRLGMVPVAYGVPAYDKIYGSAILSCDQIASFLAKSLNSPMIIEAADVDGIFTADPKVDKTAKIISKIGQNNCQEIEQYLAGSHSTDVTGGMKQKYCELIDAARAGIICKIVHYKDLKKALEGQPVGTTIDLRK